MFLISLLIYSLGTYSFAMLMVVPHLDKPTKVRQKFMDTQFIIQQKWLYNIRLELSLRPLNKFILSFKTILLSILLFERTKYVNIWFKNYTYIQTYKNTSVSNCFRRTASSISVKMLLIRILVFCYLKNILCYIDTIFDTIELVNPFKILPSFKVTRS